MSEIPPRRVVLLMTDTQRKDMVGCYGNPEMQTPNLDGLAEQGVRFERVYCCQPVCGPARAGLFTGTFPHSNGSWANVMPLGATVKTLGQRLTDHGIHAAYMGKWHLDGGDYFGMGKAPSGWDPRYWYDMRNYLEEMNEKDRARSRQVWASYDPDLLEDFTFGHRLSTRACQFLEENGAGEFFLVVSYDEPHGPHLCPSSYVDKFGNYAFPKNPNVWDVLDGKPDHQRVWAGKSTQVDRDKVVIQTPPFFGCNSFVDSEIGRVLGAIDKYAPDALVMYTADHGDALESHCLNGKGPAMYEEIVNVPFLIRWPGQAPVDTISMALMSHVDITPTLLDIFGIPPSHVIEGHSWTNVFKNPQELANEYVFLEFGRYEVDHDGFGGFQPIRCVVGEGFKLIINLLTSDELYDLENDPNEMTNLIDSPSHTTIRDHLHDSLLEWMNDTRDPFRGYYWRRRAWRLDAPPATWNDMGMTRQREADEEYEPRQLNFNTGLPIDDATRKK